MTYALKDEAAISAALQTHEKEYALFREAEKEVAERAQKRARTFGALLAAIFFVIAGVLMALAGFLFYRNHAGGGSFH